MATAFDGDAFGREVVSVVKDYLAHEITKLRAEFETRIQELESRKAIPYQGTYEDGREYSHGQFVTLNGSVWHANATTRQRPGEGGPDLVAGCKEGARCAMTPTDRRDDAATRIASIIETVAADEWQKFLIAVRRGLGVDDSETSFAKAAMSAFTVAFGCKADIPFCAAHVGF